MTGLVGVVGLMVKLTVVFGGLEGAKLEVSRQSLRLPIFASAGSVEDMVTVMRFLLSSYLGDQRGSENVVDFSVAVVEVANLIVDTGGDWCR